MSILLAVGILALVTLSGSMVYVARAVVSYRIDLPETKPESYVKAFELVVFANRLNDFETDIERLKLAVSEGIERATRVENRIQKTVTSARRLVREAGLEHAGIEAEYEELRPSDDERVEPLPAMLEAVETTRVVRFPGGSIEIGAS